MLTQAIHELFFLEVKNHLPVGDQYCRSKLNLNEIHQWWYCKLISLLSHSYSVLGLMIASQELARLNLHFYVVVTTEYC